MLYKILRHSDKISIILSFASLIIASAAFYFSILKKGHVRINVFTHPNDVSYNVKTETAEKIPTSFTVMLRILIKNIGANSVAIDRLILDISEQSQEHLKISLIGTPCYDFLILKPYEQQINSINIAIDVCGYDKGIHNPESRELIRNTPNAIKNSKFQLKVEYREYSEKRIYTRNVSFDLKPTILELYTK